MPSLQSEKKHPILQEDYVRNGRPVLLDGDPDEQHPVGDQHQPEISCIFYIVQQ